MLEGDDLASVQRPEAPKDRHCRSSDKLKLWCKVSNACFMQFHSSPHVAGMCQPAPATATSTATAPCTVFTVNIHDIMWDYHLTKPEPLPGSDIRIRLTKEATCLLQVPRLSSDASLPRYTLQCVSLQLVNGYTPLFPLSNPDHEHTLQWNS